VAKEKNQITKGTPPQSGTAETANSATASSDSKRGRHWFVLLSAVIIAVALVAVNFAVPGGSVVFSGIANAAVWFWNAMISFGELFTLSGVAAGAVGASVTAGAATLAGVTAYSVSEVKDLRENYALTINSEQTKAEEKTSNLGQKKDEALENDVRVLSQKLEKEKQKASYLEGQNTILQTLIERNNAKQPLTDGHGKGGGGRGS
jgi:hypothetical protein